MADIVAYPSRQYGVRMSDIAVQPDTDIILRPATSEDVPVILALIKALAEYQRQERQVTVTEEDLRRDGFGTSPKFECVIAELDDKPVGLAVFHPTYSTWEGASGLYIDDLFVDEAVRGKGVGQKLISNIAHTARQRNYSYLALNVVHANPARNFYDRFGFKHVDDLLTYRLVWRQV